jgi:hypothetical protein
VPEQQEFVPPATPVRVGADVLESYVGNYQFGPSAKATSAPDPPQLRVFTENSTLRIEAIGQQPIFEFEVGRPIDVLAASQEDFYVDGRYHTRISFIRGSTGRITGALLNPGRWEQYGEKID